jgi:hypothetical protein
MIDVFTFIDAFRTELWNFTSNLLILSTLITIVSVLVIWFVTESLEKIFIKRKLHKIIKWVISFIVVSGITFLLVMLFRKSIIDYTTLYYMILIGLMSEAMTMFIYLKGVKILFKLIDILFIRVEVLMINEKEDKIEAQNNVLKQKIIRDQLITRNEVEK